MDVLTVLPLRVQERGVGGGGGGVARAYRTHHYQQITVSSVPDCSKRRRIRHSSPLCEDRCETGFVTVYLLCDRKQVNNLRILFNYPLLHRTATAFIREVVHILSISIYQ